MVWQVYGPCPLLCETAPLLPGPYPGVRRSRRRQVSTRPKSLPQGGRWHGVFSGKNQRPSRGRSAGPDFSPMRNRGKNRLGRSPLRTSPGYEAGPASVLRSALAPVGSHGWSGKSMDRAPFSVRRPLSFQGLTLVCGVPAAVRSPPGQKASLREGGGTASRALTQWAERSGLSKTSDKSLFSVPTCKCTARLLPQSPPVTAPSRREPSPQPSSLCFN